MFETVMGSAKLFFQGKLFRDTGLAIRLLLLGALIAAAVTVAVGLVLPVWAAGIAGGFVGGGVQPWLYRNIKYA
ncbi:hypothetical protein E6W36_10965 [Hankyongella ginsenosidimutans]|uniref:Uncharacterized protein n=1 Tax=Hankyongella ginsenosidimutans TaxID=1763828 RepID=A0A4D7BWR2_9SPHN|nr:hypothetical protein [Hankyongella ginsenosidimutans]QCI79839.1 hypothetical protein E6W36_10965 [Hankyongella ginsenosidimutans]